MEVINIKYVRLYILYEVIYFSYFLEVINMKTLKKIVLSLLLVAGISNVNLNSMIVDGFLRNTNYPQALVEAAGFRVDGANRVRLPNGQFASYVNIQANVPNGQNGHDEQDDFVQYDRPIINDHQDEQNDIVVLNADNDAILRAVNSFLRNSFDQFNQRMDDLNNALAANNIITNDLINQVAFLRTKLNEFNNILLNVNIQEIVEAYERCNNRLNIAENRIREILININLIRNVSTVENLTYKAYDRMYEFFNDSYDQAYELAHTAYDQTIERAQELHPLRRIKAIVDNFNFTRRTRELSVEILAGGFAVIRLVSSVMGRSIAPIEEIVELLALAGITAYEIRKN